MRGRSEKEQSAVKRNKMMLEAGRSLAPVIGSDVSRAWTHNEGRSHRGEGPVCERGPRALLAALSRSPFRSSRRRFIALRGSGTLRELPLEAATIFASLSRKPDMPPSPTACSPSSTVVSLFQPETRHVSLDNEPVDQTTGTSSAPTKPAPVRAPATTPTLVPTTARATTRVTSLLAHSRARRSRLGGTKMTRCGSSESHMCGSFGAGDRSGVVTAPFKLGDQARPSRAVSHAEAHLRKASSLIDFV